MAKATRKVSARSGSEATKFVYVTRGNYAGKFLQIEESLAAAANGDQWGISAFSEGVDGADPTGFNTSIPEGWDTSPFNLPQSLIDFQDSVLPPPPDEGGEGGGGEETPTPTLTSLVPDTVEIGGPDITLACIGTGFTAETRIVFGGGQENTIMISDTEVTTVVKPSTAQAAVSVPVYVETAGKQSDPLDFTFTEVVEE